MSTPTDIPTPTPTEPEAPAPAPTPTPEPTPEREPAGDEPLTDTQMKKVWDFDPFPAEGKQLAEPTPEPAAEPTPEPAAEPVQVAPTPQPAPPQPAPVAAPAAAAEAVTPTPTEIESLRSIIEEQKRLIDSLSQARATAPREAPRQPAQTPQDTEPLPDYNFDIPDTIVEGFVAEDPQVRKLAITQLVRGLAQSVHTSMREEATRRIQPAVQQAVRQATANSQQNSNIFNDFYTTYPQFRNPAIMPSVQQAAQEVMAEMGNVNWGPTLRDAIAAKTQQKLQVLAGFAQPAPQPVPPQAPAPVVAPQPAPQPAGLQAPNLVAPGASPGAVNPTAIDAQVADLLFGR